MIRNRSGGIQRRNPLPSRIFEEFYDGDRPVPITDGGRQIARLFPTPQ